jgi:hypothetical protein
MKEIFGNANVKIQKVHYKLYRKLLYLKHKFLN